jgi:hypothetical protein
MMSQEQEQETASAEQRLEADPALEPELAHERDEGEAGTEAAADEPEAEAEGEAVEDEEAEDA